MKLSQNEAAQLLQVSERTITRWIQQLGLPHRPGAGGPAFDRNELIDWANAHSLRLAMDVPGEQDGPLPELAATLERGGVHYDLGGDDVDSALGEVSVRLPLPELVHRDFFHQVLLAREDLGSTGIGEGVAIPHVRSPLVLHIDEPVVGLFFLQRPIDWGALDGLGRAGAVHDRQPRGALPPPPALADRLLAARSGPAQPARAAGGPGTDPRADPRARREGRRGLASPLTQMLGAGVGVESR